MPLYRTIYDSPEEDIEFQTQVWAHDEAHLAKVIALRNFDERPGGLWNQPDRIPELPTELLKKGQFAAAMHAMTWLAMIVTKHSPKDTFELFSDKGLYHEMVHEEVLAENREREPSKCNCRACQEARKFKGTELELAAKQTLANLGDDIRDFELSVPGAAREWEDPKFVPPQRYHQHPPEINLADILRQLREAA